MLNAETILEQARPRRAKVDVPEEVKHEWTLDESKPARAGRIYRHVCQPCGQWTANLPLYKDDVCPAKDRRKKAEQRREADR